MSPTIAITIADERWRAVSGLEALAQAAVGQALAESGDTLPDAAELSILLCDDAFIAGLNGKWRGLEKPTNVLSFPVAVDGSGARRHRRGLRDGGRARPARKARACATISAT